MVLSASASDDHPGPKTMVFSGLLGSRSVSILLDSGSTHTFISETVAKDCSVIAALPAPLHVQVANGTVPSCDSYVPATVWSVQGIQFTSNMKVLPLTSYDIILGLNWLVLHSPMKIHWAQQWVQIPHGGSLVKLFGQLSTLPAESVLHLCTSVTDTKPVPVATHPPEIQQLLDVFPQLFEPPSQVPPSRACDHSIPLVAGASPTYSRPYRFAPAVKDEIEK